MSDVELAAKIDSPIDSGPLEDLVKPGDTVKLEDPLVTLESDKATVEVEAPANGVLQELKLEVGAEAKEGAVIAMGVFISASTRIYDRERDEVSYGRVPAGAVVVSGSLPAANGKYSLYCAVIVKQVDEKTRSKTSINELLRA